MQSRNLGMVVLDHVLHVLWQMCAVVGLATIPWIPASAGEVRPVLAPIVVGLVFGLLTMPAVLRIVRPRLERRFPWAFGG